MKFQGLLFYANIEDGSFLLGFWWQSPALPFLEASAWVKVNLSNMNEPLCECVFYMCFLSANEIFKKYYRV